MAKSGIFTGPEPWKWQAPVLEMKKGFEQDFAGLNARIHVHVQDIETREGVSLSEIVVRSPQFRFAEWRYSYRLAENERGVGVVQLKGYASGCGGSLAFAN